MAGDDTAATILKILSGVQSGVDVALLDGEYTLGSGDDDDIQFFDVSLKSGHARLSICDGKITIAGAAGQLRTGNDIVLPADGDFHEIEPLDVVSAGTTRFALGPRTANWASITDAVGDAAAFAESGQRKAAGAKAADGLRKRFWLAGVAVAVLLLVVAGGGLARDYVGQHRMPREDTKATDLAMVRAALQPLDFARGLEIRQELDGVIYITGHVNAPVERRAVQAAIRNTAVPARLRIAVTELIRSEVAHLIAAEGYDVDFTLTPAGHLTLTGIILDERKANALVAAIGEQVTGVASLSSEIRTAPTLLADAQMLSERARTHPLILLRLDGELIEVSGVLPIDKIDAWVGFLQAYASQLAAIIPLRSFVQLQNPDGSVTPPPPGGISALSLGAGAAEHDIPLDVERLRSGQFDLSDVFVAQKAAPKMTVSALDNAAASADVARNPAGAPGSGRPELPSPSGSSSERGASSSPQAADETSAGTRKTSQALRGLQGGSGGTDYSVGVRQIGARPAEGWEPASGLSPTQGVSTVSQAADETSIGTGSTGHALRGLQDGSGDTDYAAGVRRVGGQLTERQEPASGFSAAQGVSTVSQTADETSAGTGSTDRAPNGSQGTDNSAGVRQIGGQLADGQEPASGFSSAGTKSTGHAPGGSQDGSGDTDNSAGLREMARRLIELWQEDALTSEEGSILKRGMEALGAHALGRPQAWSPPIPERYPQLLARARPDAAFVDECSLNSLLNRQNVTGVLFWLDMLSVSTDLSLVDFDARQQPLILEAALNPESTGRCVVAATGSPARSAYLYEASRNPDFIRYITRDIAPFTLDVAGVNVVGDRYIQTRSGQKMHEGFSPQEGRRLLLVGQLGVAVEMSNGYAALIFDSSLNWQIQ